MPPSFAPIPSRPDFDGNLLLFINGILTRPSDGQAWTDRARAWFLENTEHDAHGFEYFQTAILGRLLSERRHLADAVQLLARLQAGAMQRPLLHFVAHSRGCEIARRLIVEKGVPVQSLHLFAAAIDADFERNGLNQALRSGRLNRVTLWTSKEDDVLRWIAAASLGLYGRLGFTGPRNVAADVEHRVWVIERNSFNHGDYFGRHNFEPSMKAVAWDVDDLPMR